MIVIIDYGLGNIQAFVNIYKRLHIIPRVIRSPDQLADATKVILPGVGAFDGAMERLNRSGFRPALEELVVKNGVPLLGVCVGMQMLARSSEEGSLKGLGWIPGVVKRVDESRMTKQTRLPHMGWNNISPCREHPLFRELDNHSRFYFLHSYYFVPDRREEILATVEYGEKFTCAVGYNNVYGVQFHPEKSHGFGAKLLMNFANL